MAQEYEFKAAVGLLASDMQGSVLLHRRLPDALRLSYTPYGSLSPEITKPPLLGFNSQLRDLAGRYLLGNGYRLFSPQLMRFLSPDSLSPFEAGGINAYIYCSADPINNIDPSGHTKTRPLAYLLDPIGISQGHIYKSVIVDGERRLDPSQKLTLSPDYKNAITSKTKESEDLLNKLNSLNDDRHVKQYTTLRAQHTKHQKAMKANPRSDRGEKDLYRRDLDSASSLISEMETIERQRPTVKEWLELRTIEQTIKNDITKAGAILRIED
ncbi:RHS repeat-associated core domain-containing protein [Mitsuaria sp. RG]|nr:RHS repeat-associated core domain-containing protein [Mitsuaria sp. RG]